MNHKRLYAKKLWNKLIKMLKGLAKRSRREKNFFFANTKNIPATNAITPITPIETTGNNEPNEKLKF